MRKSEFKKETFLKDVKDHKMTIFLDNEEYRHIVFKRPDTICMGFQLVTFPGHLVYTGDMGSYTFMRLRDMFEFFRDDPSHGISYAYWAEKCVAMDKTDKIKEFDEDVFQQEIEDYFLEWLKEHKTTKDERLKLWEAIESDVIRGDGNSRDRYTAALDFLYNVRDGLEFYFQDFWEVGCTTYTHRFLWCCHALRWGIQQYDEYKK